MVLACGGKILLFVSDLSSNLKTLIYAIEAVCCVPKCHGPLFFPEILPCPSLYQSLLAPWSWASEGREKPRGQEDVPPSRLATLCAEGVPAQILPSSTLASSTICCKVQGSSTVDPDETSLPSSSPWWWPGIRIYKIQVYQKTYYNLHGLFFFISSVLVSYSWS